MQGFIGAGVKGKAYVVGLWPLAYLLVTWLSHGRMPMQVLPFPLDRFQTTALAKLLAGESVVVCAPTGAGKTAIAEAAAAATLARGQRVIYTTPLKALSNQKLAEMRKRFGHARCGLQTGDASLNTEADIVVMTAEILRNIMFRGVGGSGAGRSVGGATDGSPSQGSWGGVEGGGGGSLEGRLDTMSDADRSELEGGEPLRGVSAGADMGAGAGADVIPPHLLFTTERGTREARLGNVGLIVMDEVSEG